VWWSPDLGTVLANEEVEEWKAKGHSVERRPLRQWMLRITKYAQRLIDDLEGLDWPEGIKLLQKNWIGRSEGAEVVFQIDGHDITVFTTRPDTLFGATYMVLAPEHPLVEQITTAEQRDAVDAYRKACASKSDLDRGDLNKDKSGVFTGAHAINPVNGEAIPVWIADYVMMGYGTGAIMAVPAHDERDFEFATKYGLPIKQVVSRSVGVPPTPSNFLNPGESIEKHQTYNLPHWQQEERLYFVTWRLADSLPADKLNQWKEERDAWIASHPEPWNEETENEYHERFSNTIDTWLDAGSGECILKDPKIAAIVADALRHFDGQRYQLEAFVVMPNHVHVLFQLSADYKLEDVIQSWKSFTAKEINKTRGASGEVWQRDYWDRIIRNPEHLENTGRYIARNPEKAGLREGEYALYQSGVGGTPTLLEAFTDAGIAINSGFLDGLPTAEAKAKMIDWLEETGKGSRRVQFKLRDWLFSRQRYWGEPFPIVWKDGEHHPLPESQLPLLAPPLEDYKPSGSPEPLLAKAVDWVNLPDGSRRETNTMPQWAGSCWYYLRYCDPKNSDRFLSREAESYWSGQGSAGVPPASSTEAGKMPALPSGMVDLYVGGTEHAVLHLLYARFWHKVLFDLGHLSTSEPFQKLVNQGLILGEDGQKMSKSRGNVVNPDDVVSAYGADSLRLYEMFMGPLQDAKPWSMNGVEGVHRFLAKVWRLVVEEPEDGSPSRLSPKLWDNRREPGMVPAALRKVVHETIRKVTEDIDKLAFNTAIAQMMVCTRAFIAAEKLPLAELLDFLKVLCPFAPHLAEELNDRLRAGFPDLDARQLGDQPWPAWDPAALVEDEVEIVIQVNGKLRDRITVATGAAREEVERAALATPKIAGLLEGLTVRKVIVVPGKLVNIVAN